MALIPAEDVRHDVARLSELLRQRKANARILYNYYDGNHPLPWVHRKAKESYKLLLRQAINNFPALVVDSLNDRLSVTGFRVDSADADAELWGMWQENDLDIVSPMVQLESLITSVSYMSCWPDAEDDSKVKIAGESSFEVIHEADPADPYEVRRALKVWPNKFDKKWYGRYFADGVYVKLESPISSSDALALDFGMVSLAEPANWIIVETTDSPLNEDMSPYTPFINRPGLDGAGRGEFSDVLPNIDRINTLTAQMLLAGEFSAFKIKWATGIDIPTDDEGNDIEPFDVAMDRLWVSENDAAKFGSIDATDLTPYQNAVNQAIQHLAAITRTPPFMLLGNLTNLSAEALKATESGQVKKAVQRQASFSESYENVMRKALSIIGDPRAEAKTMETVWADPENVSESQHVDALSKLYAMGLPQKAVWELYGASPQQMERWDGMRSEDVFHRVMLATASKAPGLDQQQPAPGQDAQSGPQGGSPTAQLQQMPDAGGAQ